MTVPRALLRFWLIPVLALSIGACGTAEGPAISEADKKLGAEQHPQLLAEFGGAYDGEEAPYVAALGSRLAEQAGLKGQCTFTLVNTDVVNAFAVPGCYVYVTRGLLGIVNSEAELASVLAHEVGHIAGNHSNRQQRNSVLRQLGVIAIAIISDSPRLTQLAGAAAGLFDLRYSRAHEYEADDLGLRYLRAAGYDPYAAADMLDALERHAAFQAGDKEEGDAARIPEWQLTHPLTENRIARARDAAARTGLKPDSLPEREAEYLREVDGLLYGDDPEQGFILGRRFAHPVMRIAFQAPQGFTLTNSPRAVLIDGPDGIRGEFAGGPLPPPGLRAYADELLNAVVGDVPSRILSARTGRVNGVETLLVEAQAATNQGDVGLALAVYRGASGQAYHFLMIAAPGAPLEAAVQPLFASFRLLSAAEAEALRPRYIRTVPARGETPRALAGTMAVDRPLETFLMLNGVDAEDEPLAAGRVKIVSFAGG